MKYLRLSMLVFIGGIAGCGPHTEPHCDQLQLCAPQCSGMEPYASTFSDANCQDLLTTYSSYCAQGQTTYVCGQTRCSECHQP